MKYFIRERLRELLGRATTNSDASLTTFTEVLPNIPRHSRYIALSCNCHRNFGIDFFRIKEILIDKALKVTPINKIRDPTDRKFVEVKARVYFFKSIRPERWRPGNNICRVKNRLMLRRDGNTYRVGWLRKYLPQILEKPPTGK